MEIAKDLAVSDRAVRKWTEKERAEEDEERNNRILDAYLRCETQEAIAEEINVDRTTVTKVIGNVKNGTDAKIHLDPNLYDVWNFNTNDDQYGFKDYPTQDDVAKALEVDQKTISRWLGISQNIKNDKMGNPPEELTSIITDF